MNIYTDLRCLQDPDFAGRGVGTHAAALLRHARAGWHQPVRLIGLLDESLPPLPEVYQSLVDECRHGANIRPGHLPCVFFQPSPLTHEQGRLAPLLCRRGVLASTVVYDFIPLDEPGYLPTPAARVAYLTNLVWLKCYHRFAPISEYAARRLAEVVAVKPGAVRVTGAALRGAFADFNPAASRQRPHRCRFEAGRYFIMVGGSDGRKNPECLLKAHARLAREIAHPPGLVVVGAMPAGWRAHLQAFYEELGGKAEHLEFVEGLTDDELALLYHRALAAVSPSRTEGFGLPVVEAMAVGCPVLASRIEAHAELIGQAEALFDPADADELVGRMRGLWAGGDGRRQLLERQRGAAAQFAEQAVAERFWSHVRRARPRPAAPGCRRFARRPRLAFLTPFPPDRSGVAVYSARSFESISRLADVDVFTEAPGAAAQPGVRRVAPLSELPYVRPGYDRVVAVVGNHPGHHGRIVDYHCRYGGACLVHDNRLADFYYHRRGPHGLADMAGRSLGRPVSVEECEGWFHDPSRLPTLFFDELLPRAEPLIVHSRGIQANVQRLYGQAARYLPFCCYRDFSDAGLSGPSRAAARRRRGLADSRVAIVTLGAVLPSKGPWQCLWALELLRSWGTPADLYFVGEVESPPLKAELATLARKLGVANHVHWMENWITDDLYRDFVLGADLAIQLRTHGLGGVSGALQDCIAAGLPTIANEDLAASMDAPSYVRRVPDQLSPPQIAEALQEAYEAGRHRTRTGPEREAYTREHSFDRYARELLRVLEIE
jgi:glycosyltransferase involved in cell wall biosynthesis